MEPQMVAATTPLKGGDQSSESTGGTHQQQRGGEAEGQHLLKLRNNASREGKDALVVGPAQHWTRLSSGVLGN
jgi:hypothetical protein